MDEIGLWIMVEKRWALYQIRSRNPIPWIAFQSVTYCLFPDPSTRYLDLGDIDEGTRKTKITFHRAQVTLLDPLSRLW